MNRKSIIIIAAAVVVLVLLVMIPWGGSDVEEVDTANPAEELEDTTGATTTESVDQEAEVEADGD